MRQLFFAGLAGIMVAAAGILMIALLNGPAGHSDGSPDQPGFLDATPLTPADQQRLAEIAAHGIPDRVDNAQEQVIAAIQRGVRSDLTRRDFELLRQDRRRARAGYPDVDPDTLFQGVWLQVDLAARIPMAWSSGNGNGTLHNGQWYLDGGVEASVVNPLYPYRATAAETAAFFAARAVQRTAAKLARQEITWTSGGTDGSLQVTCRGDTCEVIQAAPMATTGSRYRFPFVVAEWVDDPSSIEQIKRLPSFQSATTAIVAVAPSGVLVEPFDGPADAGDNVVPFRPGMTLLPGQSTELRITIPVPSAQ